MLIVITGGSGSGKSAYAENRILSLRGEAPLYYIATMKIYDEEGSRKVQRHRQLRAGNGFITIEQPVKIEGAAGMIEEGAAVLLECMSNLTANEMFPDTGKTGTDTEQLAGHIVDGVRRLAGKTGHLVIVTNNIFEDGRHYDETTMRYMEVLGQINRELSASADEVTEVVAGIPVAMKREGKKCLL